MSEIWSCDLVHTGSRNGLISGRTAFQVTRWRHRTTVVLASSGLACVLLQTAGVPQSLFTDLLLGLLLISGLVLIVLINWAGSREDAEKKAGYTTTRLGNRKLMQRDPYMGRVIRLAGADYLDRQHFAEILERTKAEAAKTQQPR
ncbi:hypothetical protein ACIPY0_07350 [Paenarthrobacter nicotinovorans]|uniref:hypothetical protein n=1 Tax=Paenarthrobacter nicotinovorans TaxID=29320 RepID=UPI00382F77AC